MRDRVLLDVDVLTAAQQRIAWTFDTFERIALAFSGGKDSTVLMHLMMAEAARRQRRIAVMFIDWEAQYRLTVQHVQDMYRLYDGWIEPYWIALPLRTTNACSLVEPEWVCWDPDKRDLWVREPPPEAITDPAVLPFFRSRMTFEEFILGFPRWYSRGQRTASVMGIRANESLRRLNAIAKDEKPHLDGKRYTTDAGRGVYNVAPIYDWKAADIWTFHARTGLPHNTVYDRMHQAGLHPEKMRICEPYGDEQRQGLWLFHVLEPETWAKVVQRVEGANAGALYSNTRGNVAGRGTPTLPPRHTWRTFAEFLLGTLPPQHAEHYRNKIAVYIRWWQVNRDLTDLPDQQDRDCGSFDVPSWRRVCKMLLKNDYWATTLCFGAQRTHAYARYQELMRRRRQEWGLYPDGPSEEGV